MQRRVGGGQGGLGRQTAGSQRRYSDDVDEDELVSSMEGSDDGGGSSNEAQEEFDSGESGTGETSESSGDAEDANDGEHIIYAYEGQEVEIEIEGDQDGIEMTIEVQRDGDLDETGEAGQMGDWHGMEAHIEAIDENGHYMHVNAEVEDGDDDIGSRSHDEDSCKSLILICS